ncbi:MAG: zinc-binding alcohol dehydrogenase [Pseudomonadota bacterium]
MIIRMVASLISRGTERLIFEGRVPVGEYARMRAPFQEGEFPFPVKYGYAAVGQVEAGPEDLIGRHVFTLHPHQTVFALPAEAVFPADAFHPRLALAANVETALNALWDAGAGPGDRICVVGGGVVGCLVAWLAGRLPGADVTLVDRIPQRAAVASRLNVNFSLTVGELTECDIAFHCSASPGGLAAAMNTLGDEGRLIEMSWYGEGEVPAPLGGAFHSRRLQLISSQVGKVSPSRRPRWSYARRLSKAVELTAAAELDCLIDNRVAFRDAPVWMGEILSPDATNLTTLITYD